MILKPYRLSPDNQAQDSTEDITMSWVNQGDRQYKYKVEIYNNVDNMLVYESVLIASVNTFHILPANTLANGFTYKYQITVQNSIGESATSDWGMFKCSSKPVIEFPNLTSGATIGNNEYKFMGSYTQLENVPIMSWEMRLYDSLQNLLNTTNIIFGSLIEHTFSGLNSEEFYYINLIATSQDGLSSSTGLIPFSVEYETPPLAIALQAKNNKDSASVQLMWNILQITGESVNTTYIDNEKIDAKNGSVWFDNGFNIEGDFTLKLWIEEVENVPLGVNNNSSIIASATAPVDTSVIWIEDTTKVEDQSIDMVVNSSEPINVNSLWVEDVSQIDERNLNKVELSLITPTYLNTFWIDLFPSANLYEQIEILELKNDIGDNISLIYGDGTFYLFKNKVYKDSVSLISIKNYLYIQQVGDTLSLHAESI